MKKIILLLLFLSFLISTEKKNYLSVSNGILGEKIPVTFLDFSYINEINQKSEFYGTFSYIIFGFGIGFGHKYYFIDRKKFTPFFSSTLFTVAGGDSWSAQTGISLASGLNFSIPKWIPTLIEIMTSSPINSDRVEKKMNFGFTIYQNFDGTNGILPFLNVEIKMNGQKW